MLTVLQHTVPALKYTLLHRCSVLTTTNHYTIGSYISKAASLPVPHSTSIAVYLSAHANYDYPKDSVEPNDVVDAHT